MMHFSPLFADADWLRLAIFLVVGVGYLISFIATRMRDRQIAKNRMPRQPRENPDTARELEEFLRKSASGRRDAAQRPAPSMSRPQPQADSRRAARRKADDREKRRRVEAAPPPLVKLRETELTKDRAATPVGQVRSSIDTREFAQRASQLESFDDARSLAHRSISSDLGAFAASTAEGLAAQNRAAAAAAAATGGKQTLPIAAMLSGGNLRNAVILNEIFQRPEERW